MVNLIMKFLCALAILAQSAAVLWSEGGKPDLESKGETNLLQNGGFEIVKEGEKNPADWSYYGGSVSGEMELTQPGHEGKQCVRLRSDKPGYHGGIFQRPALKRYWQYKISAWVKANMTEGAQVVLLDCEGGIPVINDGQKTNKYWGVRAGARTQSFDWQYIEKTFETPVNADGTFHLGVFPVLFYERVEVWVDDARLVDMGSAFLPLMEDLIKKTERVAVSDAIMTDQKKGILDEARKLAEEMKNKTDLSADEIRDISAKITEIEKRKDTLEFMKKIVFFAGQGDPEASYKYGLCLFNGTGVQRNETEAYNLFLRAAEKNHAKGEWMAGECCLAGKGVEQDNRQAAKWFFRAAAQKVPEAQYRLGECCLDGAGVAASPKDAFQWFLKSAEAGYEPGIKKVVECYENGTGVKKSAEDAAIWRAKLSK